MTAIELIMSFPENRSPLRFMIPLIAHPDGILVKSFFISHHPFPEIPQKKRIPTSTLPL